MCVNGVISRSASSSVLSPFLVMLNVHISVHLSNVSWVLIWRQLYISGCYYI